LQVTGCATRRLAPRVFDGFNQRSRLLESETDTFARKRID
jgi:hypothetical protein